MRRKPSRPADRPFVLSPSTPFVVRQAHHERFLKGPATARGAGSSVGTAQLLQRQHQRVGAPSSVSLRPQGDVELVHERESRHRHVHAPGLVERNAHVLDEVLDEEAGIEVAASARGAPGSRASSTPRRRSGSTPASVSRFEPRARTVDQALADADHRAGDHDLVAHLGVLSGARATLVNDVLAQISNSGVTARPRRCRRRP